VSVATIEGIKPMQNASMPTNIGQPRPTVSTTQGHFCPAPSPSISELAIGEFDPNDHIVAGAYEALKSCRVAGEGVTAACRAVHADTTLSEGARHVSAADVAHKVISRPLPLIDAAGSKVSAKIVRIENKIKQPPIDNTIRAVQVATELRLFLRDSTDTARRATITKSLESGDDQILSAILSPCLSGLSQVEVDGFALMWRQRKFPAELKRIAQLEKVSKALYLGGQLLTRIHRQIARAGSNGGASAAQRAA
jgi:hypothetical protein